MRFSSYIAQVLRSAAGNKGGGDGRWSLAKRVTWTVLNVGSSHKPTAADEARRGAGLTGGRRRGVLARRQTGQDKRPRFRDEGRVTSSVVNNVWSSPVTLNDPLSLCSVSILHVQTKTLLFPYLTVYLSIDLRCVSTNAIPFC